MQECSKNNLGIMKKTGFIPVNFVVDPRGFEPRTFSLQRNCSTAELRALIISERLTHQPNGCDDNQEYSK